MGFLPACKNTTQQFTVFDVTQQTLYIFNIVLVINVNTSNSMCMHVCVKETVMHEIVL